MGRAEVQSLWSATSSRSLPTLDGLRALAVAAVFGLHFVSLWIPGRFGVLLFFVLSGFLITGTLFRDDEQGRLSLGAFYRRRTLRIFPAFYAFMALHFALYGAGYMPGRFWAMAYLSNYYIGLKNAYIPGLVHTWSLAVEEQFYLLWPLLFLKFRSRPSALFTGLLVVIAAVQMYRIGMFAAGASQAYLESAFETRCDALAVGCALAVAWHTGRPVIALMLQRAAAWLALAVVAMATVIEAKAPVWSITFLYTVTAIAFAVLIAHGVVHATDGPWRWLNYPAVRYIGRISYGVYLYHVAAMEKMALPLGRSLHLRYSVTVALGLLLTIGISALSFHTIEQWFMRLARRAPRAGVARQAVAGAEPGTTA